MPTAASTASRNPSTLRARPMKFSENRYGRACRPASTGPPKKMAVVQPALVTTSIHHTPRGSRDRAVPASASALKTSTTTADPM